MSIEIYDCEELDLMNKQAHIVTNQPKNINRLYLSWKNPEGNECKMIGPETKCFCNHRFKQHQYVNPKNRNTLCNTKGCKCNAFQYIPTHGAYDFKCLCKHSFKDHDRNSKICQKQKCSNCCGFASAWTCSCGKKYDKHITVAETFLERKKQGKAIDDMTRMAIQIEASIKQGSLYRPIKQDREQKLKRYSEVTGRDSIMTSQTIKNAKNYEDEIQEINFKKFTAKKRI